MKQLTLFFLTSLCALTLYAEQPSNHFLVGYVDQELIISELPQTKILEENLDSQTVVYEAEYAVMQKEYNQRVKQYIELNKQMSEPIKMARQAEITEYERRLVLYKQRYQEHLKQMRIEGEAKIKNRISEAITKVAAENNVNIVFDQSQPLYTDTNCIDLTPLVKKQLGI